LVLLGSLDRFVFVAQKKKKKKADSRLHVTMGTVARTRRLRGDRGCLGGVPDAARAGGGDGDDGSSSSGDESSSSAPRPAASAFALLGGGGDSDSESESASESLSSPEAMPEVADPDGLAAETCVMI
jgi:hypothetical protein